MTIIPGLLGMPALLTLFIYVSWFTFPLPGTSNYNAVKAIMVPAMIAGSIMAYSLFSIAAFSPGDEPIRFSRHDKKIYRYQALKARWLGMDVYHFKAKADVEVYDWENCRAEVVRKLITTVTTMRRDCFLDLAIIDPSTNKVIKRFRVGDRDLYGDFSFRLFLWETIRRYMESGPSAIPLQILKANRETIADCIDEFNPFSLPSKSGFGEQKVLSYLLAGLLWLISLPTILAVFSRWVEFKISRKVEWGILQQDVFKVSDKEAVFIKDSPPDTDAKKMVMYLRERRNSAFLWFTSILLQLTFLWWFFFIPSYCR